LFCGEFEVFEELLLFTPVEQLRTSIMSWESLYFLEKVSIKECVGRKDFDFFVLKIRIKIKLVCLVVLTICY